MKPIVFATLSLLLAGCAARLDRPETHPAKGTVLFDGKPATGARLRLTSVDNPLLDKLVPHAEVAADGSYRLTTFRTADGAPAGRYAVTLTWPLPGRPGKEEQGPDRFKGRFADPRRPIGTVEIVAGENVLEPIPLR
jgi:hypothetical protein